VPCVQSDTGNVTAGAGLGASFGPAGPPACTYQAQSIESQQRVDGTLQLDAFGTFALKVTCNGTATETIISNVITVACGAGLQLSSGRCVPTSPTCGPDAVRIAARCMQAPSLRAWSDAQALFERVPNSAASAGSVRALNVALVLQGGLDVEWSVNCSGASTAPWLAFEPVADRTLTPDVPVVMNMSLNVSEQHDFSLSGDLHTTLVIESRIPSSPDVSFEGRSIVMPVRVRVAAEPCVALQDVQVETGASGRRSVGGDARVEGIERTSSVIIYVRAYDCRRYPIQRYLDDYPLHVRMGDGGSALVLDATSDKMRVMVYAPTDAEKNLYHLTLPPAWVNATGEVRLIVYTNGQGAANSTSGVCITLVLGEGLGVVNYLVLTAKLIAVGLFVLLLCVLLRILWRNRAAAWATLKSCMTFEVRLGVEMRMSLQARPSARACPPPR
jgi:hypothetical protein